jgi:transglutaminase-like putative cysteine protease
MTILTVRHITTYQYKQPVSFGEHRMMLRPRESHDQRLLESKLEITPKPTNLRWIQDAFGNHLAIARFGGRAEALRFDSTVRLDHSPADIVDMDIEDFARAYPFTYDAGDRPDVVHFIERQSLDPHHQLDQWVHSVLRKGGSTNTRALLVNLTRTIKQTFTYVARHEKGIQHPLLTLKLGSGSCRDLAMLMIEAVRSLGMAARFVSGYLHVPDRDDDGMPAAETRTPGSRSICPAPAGSISIRQAGSSATAASCVSRWSAIHARRYRCTALGPVFPRTIWA